MSPHIIPGTGAVGGVISAIALALLTLLPDDICKAVLGCLVLAIIWIVLSVLLTVFINIVIFLP